MRPIMAARGRKYFSRQPDSQNNFGLLIGHTLTYLGTHNSIKKSHIAADAGSQQNVTTEVGITDGNTSNLRVQYTVTLPHDFGAGPTCFGMASKQLYGGVDIAFVGGDNGVLCAVMMETGSITYAPGYGPCMMSMNTGNSVMTTSVWALASLENGSPTSRLSAGVARPKSHVSSAPPPEPVRRGTAGGTSVGTITWVYGKPLVFVGFLSGRIEWFQVTAGSGHSVGNGENTEPMGRGVFMTVAETPKRECVATASATHGLPSGMGGTDKSSNNKPRCSLRSSGVWGGGPSEKDDRSPAAYDCKNGVTTFLRVKSCHCSVDIPDTGGFLTSDCVSGSGHVVAGTQWAIYVFSSERPEAPVQKIYHTGCSYLACHPFLPLIACLWSDEAATACGKMLSYSGGSRSPSYFLNILEGDPDGGLVVVAEERMSAPANVNDTDDQCAHFNCSWKFSVDPQLAVCGIKEGVAQLFDFSLAREYWRDDETTAAISHDPKTLLQRRRYELNGCELSFPLSSHVSVGFVSAGLCEHWFSTTKLSAGATATAAQALGGTDRRFVPSAFTSSHHATRSGVASAMRVRREEVLDSTPCTTHGPDPNVWSSFSAKEGNERLKANQAIARNTESVVDAASYVVIVNAVGEIAVIPAYSPARIASLGSGCFAVGVRSTICLWNISAAGWGDDSKHVVSATRDEQYIKGGCSSGGEECSSSEHAIDIGARMRNRLAAGFGVFAASNVEAIRRLKDNHPSLIDEGILFSYIAVLEKVGVVGGSGPVPSLTELLTLDTGPNTTQLTDHGLLPHNTAVVCRSSASPNDSRRLLLLYILEWIPKPHASMSQSNVRFTTRADVERAVAVDVLHRHRSRAAALLKQHQHLDPTYPAVAGMIDNYDLVVGSKCEYSTEMRERFLGHLSPWLRVVFTFENKKEEIYLNSDLPLWDRIAIALILEYNTAHLLELLHTCFAPQCNMVQRLLLFSGISARACGLMQEIVDCTADFQLAVCLFARVGVPAVNLRSKKPVDHESGAVSSCVSGAFSEKEVDNVSGCDDEPIAAARYWTRWFAAYCAFLNDEQEFVLRAVFELQCRQLDDSTMLNECEDPSKTCKVRSTCEGDAPIGFPTSSNSSSSKLKLLGVGHRRCCVCNDAVRLGSSLLASSYAQCAACGHGGHVDHIQAWFAAHRLCAVFGCRCRCEASGGVF